VVQCTKSDLSGALSVEEVLRGIGASGLSAVQAVATSGEGVLQSLGAVVKGILARLRESREEGEETLSPLAPAAEKDEATVPVEEGAWSAPQVERESVSPAPPEQRAERLVEPVLEIAGLPEITAEGLCRLPLVVRCADRERRYVLSISLSPEGK
jgi:hypothetical protein